MSGYYGQRNKALEHDSQAAVIDYCNARGWHLAFAVPNMGKRSRGAARYFRDEGLKKGALDIVFPYPRKGFHGVFIEMKREGEMPTTEQKDFIKGLRREGFIAGVGWNAEETINFLDSYMEVKCSKRR